MPFRKGTTPPRLRGKGIPRKYIDLFIKVFNSAYARTKDEGSAYRQAYAVMGRALRKAGYHKGKDGKWHKSVASEKTVEFPVTTLSQHDASLIVLEEKSLEEAESEGLRFKGVALVDYAVVGAGTDHERLFTPEFNDKCLQQSLEFMSLGHNITIYNKHASALGSFFGSEKNPIGRVEKLYREDDRIVYEAYISPTTEGKDVIRLILDGIVMESSVRIYNVEYDSLRLQYDLDGTYLEDGEVGEITVITAGIIKGIDLCDEAAIDEAGIVQVLESSDAAEWIDLIVDEEDNMDWDEVTLEMLLKHVPHLLEEYAEALGDGDVLEQTQDALEQAQEKLAAFEEKVEALQEENADLQQKVEELSTAVTDLTMSLAIEQAAQTGIGRRVAEELRSRAVALDDIEAAAAEIRKKVIQEMASAALSTRNSEARVSATGHTRIGDGEPVAESAEDDAETLDAKQQEVLRFAM